MTKKPALCTSKTGVYETPQYLFDRYDRIYNFNTDVCALPENAKCAHFYSPQQDGLVQKWAGSCWMNPPYGKGIDLWMRKAFESAQAGAVVVCLVPVRTSSAWWHDWAMRGDIEFLRGRLRFSGAEFDAPFSSAVVVFRPAD